MLQTRESSWTIWRTGIGFALLLPSFHTCSFSSQTVEVTSWGSFIHNEHSSHNNKCKLRFDGNSSVLFVVALFSQLLLTVFLCKCSSFSILLPTNFVCANLRVGGERKHLESDKVRVLKSRKRFRFRESFLWVYWVDFVCCCGFKQKLNNPMIHQAPPEFTSDVWFMLETQGMEKIIHKARK